jgi:hypothetical protein
VILTRPNDGGLGQEKKKAYNIKILASKNGLLKRVPGVYKAP